MSSIYVKHIYAQLNSNCKVEIINQLDGDMLFEGDADDIPPAILLLEVRQFSMSNDKCKLFVN